MLNFLNYFLGSGGGIVLSTLTQYIIYIVVIAYVLLAIVKPVIVSRNHALHIDRLAGSPTRHWFYGHYGTLPYGEEGFRKRAELTVQYPTMFTFWSSPITSSLNVHHPDSVMALLNRGAQKNPMLYGLLKPWLGDGLLVSSGKKWFRNRRLLTPAFHFSILKPYTNIFNDGAKIMLNNWHEIGEDKSIEISESVSLLTLDAMLKCAMSSDLNAQNVKGNHPYIKAVHDAQMLIEKRVRNPFHLIDWIYKLSSNGKRFYKCVNWLHKYTEKIIHERKEAIKNALERNNQDCNLGSDNEQEEFRFIRRGKKSLDFLDILLQTKGEDGIGLTDSEIRDEVDTFLFEGHDTTSSGVSWALYNLAKYPEMQEKCRDEVVKIVGEKENVEWNDLGKFTYLTYFLKESMRMFPAVFTISRKLQEPITILSDLNKNYKTIIPKDTLVTLHLYMLHHNRHVWKEPEVFDPLRFTPENSSMRSPHAYLPFSAGGRNCIGQNFAMNEIKVIIAQTLKRYLLYLDEETPKPFLAQRITLQSGNGIYLKIKKINNTN